jgi:hypothetical protein
LTEETGYFDLVQFVYPLIEEAKKQNLTLRASAGIGIKIHCDGVARRYPVLNRPLHDIDLFGRSKDLKRITKFMESQGFAKVPTSLNAAFSFREIYIYPQTKLEVDIFLDRLQMNHTIEIKDRLELDYPTITVSDLLLQKLQIVKLALKDITDMVMLLSEHSLGEGEKEQVNVPYITKALSDDWGFYYTTTTNLQKILEHLARIDGLDDTIRDDVKNKCNELSREIEAYPKNFGWKIRAKIGTSKRWYREVERETDTSI